MTVQITVAGPLAEALHAVYRMGTVLDLVSHGAVESGAGVDAVRITAHLHSGLARQTVYRALGETPPEA